MPRARRVVFLAFDDLQTLDLAGPAEVFATAGFLGASPPYALETVAPGPGPIRSHAGLTIVPDGTLAAVRGTVDTFVVVGGDGVAGLVADPEVLRHIRRIAGRARRVVSVCSGTFALAEAGLLDGRRATTHWVACDLLEQHYPRVEVEPDAIFVRDGNVYTSAGVTAGIDLCLALVEADHGRELALAVARRLVVFLKRPGGQSQFSAQLQVQTADRDAIADVQGWIADHLADDLTVDALAERAAMSPRHFARVFRAQVGVTPARFVERARVEAARRGLEESERAVDLIARQCGFGTAETMRRAFVRTMHVAPSDYRRRFRPPAPRGAVATTASTMEVAS